MDARADERFELLILPPPGWKRPLMAIASFAVGVGATVALAPGGRRARVVERASGAVVAVVDEPWLTDGQARFDALVRDHAESTAAEFERAWLG